MSAPNAPLPWKIEWLDGCTWRAAVTGGWVICYSNKIASTCMVFIADTNHSWTLS